MADDSELFIFFILLFAAGLFIYKWYKPIFSIWVPDRRKTGKIVLASLPIVSFVIMLVTLKTIASYDVVDNFFFIFFYILMGYAWLLVGVYVITALFDLSPVDDIIVLDNKAASIAFAGGFIGITLIYSGANIGDGPGWWCVVFAGGLGCVAWAVLALIINALTQVFERVSVDRDISCSIRLGSYLLSSGIILGRASAGDWTSGWKTIVEFAAAWPVLLPAVFMVLFERVAAKTPKGRDTKNEWLSGSVVFGIFIIVFAVLSVIFLSPLPQNPMYT